ncbi:MAG: hypothetical protein F4X83_03205 [Chloroflexi bacterium]|nr:hypothetical protein [Chloroflexota bacterium]
MSNERSRANLLEFLKYLADKGLIAKNTANARRAAAGKVLQILSDEEAHDVTKLNLDEVMSRFQNLEGKGYTPASLATYRARIKTAVDDFENYLENPLGFKPTVRRRESNKPKSATSARREQPKSSSGASHSNTAPQLMSKSIVPVPIRQATTVYIQGLPFDLSEAEADRIANVIRAMATPV